MLIDNNKKSLNNNASIRDLSLKIATIIGFQVFLITEILSLFSSLNAKNLIFYCPKYFLTLNISLNIALLSLLTIKRVICK